MNARDASTATSWAERNQHWLVREMAALRGRLERRPPHRRDRASTAPAAGLDGLDAVTADRPEDADFVPALDHVARAYALTPFERELLLLAVAAEIDAGMRALLAAHAPAGPSFALALEALDGGHWDALGPQAPLRHGLLLRLPEGTLPLHAPLQVDERVLHFVCGVAACSAELAARARWVTEAPLADAQGVERLATVLHEGGSALRVRLTGDAPAATRHDTAVAGVLAAGMRPLVMRAHDLPADAAEREHLARLVDREAALVDAVLVLHGDAELPPHAIALLASLQACVVLTAPLPAAGQRDLAEPWQRVALVRRAAPPGWVPPALRPALDEARQQFRLDPRELADALQACATDDPEALWAALREAARGGLDALAQRIDSDIGFDDLVLPAGTLAQLRAIAGQLRHRHRVYHEWGFARRGARGLGIAALFAGDSGTGKTMAAEAIANEARLDLYRIDLAGTVSKYIGETEKNLARIFDAAEASGAVLLFDEADALFGKRSEVKDSHDRYANIEIAYLLQRVESYRGLAILTTNLKSALDKAFLRRIRFVVQFPFPDEAARLELWRRQFPAAAPTHALDLRALASLQLAGGHIRSVALNAAFAAAAREGPITQPVVMDAARAEFAKLERPLHGSLPRGTSVEAAR